jgi:hypothetical protein
MRFGNLSPNGNTDVAKKHPRRLSVTGALASTFRLDHLDRL